MSAILLDTHTFIWLAENDPKLPTFVKDTIQLYNLPFYLKDHKDPFDRLLIAQAISRSLPLASCDRNFDAYPVQKVWA
jgi:PIN domain nuclease of toxin-antitoxin system